MEDLRPRQEPVYSQRRVHLNTRPNSMSLSPFNLDARDVRSSVSTELHAETKTKPRGRLKFRVPHSRSTEDMKSTE